MLQVDVVALVVVEEVEEEAEADPLVEVDEAVSAVTVEALAVDEVRTHSLNDISTLNLQALQVVVVEEFQSAAVTEADEVEDEVLPLEVVVDVVVQGAAEAAQRAVRTLSSNLTDILVFSSPKARRACWSRRTWSLESLSTARRGFRLTEALMVRRSNTVCGILSVRSWLLVSLAVWTTFSSSLARRFSTLVPPVVPVFLT